MSLPLEIPPGILKVDSPNAGKGRFTDSDKIRFENGFAEKWAGWELFNDTQLEGKARGAAFWTNQYGNPNAAFGTTVRLYALTGTDMITDITPIRTAAAQRERLLQLLSHDMRSPQASIHRARLDRS